MLDPFLFRGEQRVKTKLMKKISDSDTLTHYSNWRSTKHRVRQGPVVGPLLFSMHI